MRKEIGLHPNSSIYISIEDIAFFSFLKIHYNNGKVYDWNLNKMVRWINSRGKLISRGSLKKKLARLFELGLIGEFNTKRDNKTLEIYSLKKLLNDEIYKPGWCSIKVNKKTTLGEIIYQIRKIVIKQNLNQQAFKADTSHTCKMQKRGMKDRHSLETTDFAALAKLVFRSKNLPKSRVQLVTERRLYRLIITVRSVARLLKCSESTAYNWINQAKKRGELKTKRIVKKLSNSPAGFKYLKDSHGGFSVDMYKLGYLYANKNGIFYDLGQEVLDLK